MDNLTVGPSSEDWQLAVRALALIDDLDDERFRGELRQLALALEGEGLAAHRSADRLEGRSVYTTGGPPTEYVAEAIWTRVCTWYQDRHWILIGSYIDRLGAVGLEDPNQLRQQAATILDAAQLLNEIVQWYEARRAAIGARDLTNDTIVAIIFDWGLTPTRMVEQLMAHGHPAITVNAVAMALSRHRERVATGIGAEGPGPMSVLMRGMTNQE